MPDHKFVEDWEDAWELYHEVKNGKVIDLDATMDAWEKAHPKPKKYRTIEAWQRDRDRFMDETMDQAAADWHFYHGKPRESSMPEFHFDVTISIPVSVTADDEAAARAGVEKAISDTLFNQSQGVDDALALSTHDQATVEMELVEDEEA